MVSMYCYFKSALEIMITYPSGFETPVTFLIICRNTASWLNLSLLIKVRNVSALSTI